MYDKKDMSPNKYACQSGKALTTTCMRIHRSFLNYAYTVTKELCPLRRHSTCSMSALPMHMQILQVLYLSTLSRRSDTPWLSMHPQWSFPCIVMHPSSAYLSKFCLIVKLLTYSNWAWGSGRPMQPHLHGPIFAWAAKIPLQNQVRSSKTGSCNAMVDGYGSLKIQIMSLCGTRQGAIMMPMPGQQHPDAAWGIRTQTQQDSIDQNIVSTIYEKQGK